MTGRSGDPFLLFPLVLGVVFAACGCDTRDVSNSLPEDTTDTAAPGKTAGACRVRFEDETRERGIDFVQFNGRSDDRFFVEPLGSGVIFFDADGDGDPDLYLPNQTTIAAPSPEPRAHSAFYLNDGTGRFTDATEASGLLDAGYALGVCGADIDNDGDTDLYVTHFERPNLLFRNDSEPGRSRFREIAAAAGVEGDATTDASCAFADVDGDGFVDLYVAGYVDHDRENNPVCYRRLKADGRRVRAYCTPRHFKPVRDILYHNRGDGTFEDVSEASGISAGLGRSLGVAFADADGDGDADLFVACDRTASLLFENLGDGSFRERAHESGVALSMDGNEEAGMGTAWGDYDGDGLPDLVKTNFEFEHNNLYRNAGGFRFTEMTVGAGTGRASFGYVAWGIGFFDADNDSDLDLFVANGHLRDWSLYEQGRKKRGGTGYAQANLFYENVGSGRFVSRGEAAGPALAVERVSRGVAWADIDADGDLDFIVANLHDRPRLHVNTSVGLGHWLEVRCVGTKSNRSAIGTRLTAALATRIVTRQVRSGQSYLSQSDLTVHFGLADESVVRRLTISWPSGLVETYADVAADQILEIIEGSAR